MVQVREALTRYLSTGVDQPLVLGAHLNGDESPWYVVIFDSRVQHYFGVILQSGV